MTVRGHRRTPILLIVTLLTTWVWVMIGATGVESAEKKTYTAAVTPSTVTAGTTPTFTVTVSNQSSQQQIGSANVTPPAGFVLDTNDARVVSNVLELRNLAVPPGGNGVYTVAANVPCGTSSGSWTVVAKQANNFSGTGNDFRLANTGNQLSTTVTPCVVTATALRFVNQPADTEKNTVITTVAGSTAGDPIRVEVVDADGNRVTSSTASITMTKSGGAAGAVLSGTTTQSAVSGVASFADLKIDKESTGYQLVASSSGLTQAMSNQFGIWDEIKACAADESCDTEVRSDDMRGGVNVTSSKPGAVLVSIGMDTVNCGDSFNHPPETMTVDSIGLDGTKTVSITVSKAYDQIQANNGVSFYEICFEAVYSFTDKYGDTIPANESGLLPLCENATAPCLLSRTKSKKGDVLLVVTLPPGDPKMG